MKKTTRKPDVLREICLAYISGKSMKQIADTLNAKGISCFGSGIRWTQGQIAPQLRSALLDTVLTADEAATLRATLSRNTGRKGGTKSGWHSNLFPNRIRCAACGASVTTHNVDGGKGKPKTTRYYRCSAKCRTFHRAMVRIDAVEVDFFMLFFPGLIKSVKPLPVVGVIETLLAVNDWQRVEKLEAALNNAGIRAKLVHLLPDLVRGLSIDFEKQSYSITTTDGATTAMRLLPELHNLWYYHSRPNPNEPKDRWFFAGNRWHLRTP
jgi:hypothetical protein